MNLQYAHSTAPSETGPLVSRNDDIAKADLAEYLNDNAIQTEFQDAVKLARRHFPKSKLSWNLESDPDCVGRWVELDIAEAASPDDAMSRYDTLISDWTAAANPRVDGMIRFTINLS